MNEIVILDHNKEDSLKLKKELENICSNVYIFDPNQTEKSEFRSTENSVIFFCKLDTSNNPDILQNAIDISSVEKCPVIFIVSETDALFIDAISASDMLWYIKEPYIQSELEYIVNKVSGSLLPPMEDLRVLSESVHDIAFTMAANGNILYVSPSVERVTGFTSDEILRKGVKELVSEESFNMIGAMIGAFFTKLKKGEKIKSPVFEVESLCKDGSAIWMELTVTPIFDKDGNFRFFTGIMRDISDRKEAEERFRFAAECSNDLIYEWDMNSDHLEWFGNVEKSLGYEHGEVAGSIEGWSGIVHPDDLPYVMENIDNYRKKSDAFEAEYRVITKDGRVRYWKEHGIPVFDDVTKKFVKTIGVCTDITDKVEAEHSLKEKDEMFRLIAENANDVIWLLDTNAELRYVSPSLEKLRGFTPEEIKDAKIEDRFTPESLKLIQETWEDFFRNFTKGHIPDTKRMLEVEQPCKDGSTVWTELHINPVLDDEGNLKFFLGISRDINERHLNSKMLDSIFDLAPIPVMLLDRDGVIEKLNLECLQIIKADKDEVIGRNACEVFSCVNAFKGEKFGLAEECNSCSFRNIGLETLETQQNIRKREGIANIFQPDGSRVQLNMEISTAYIDLYGNAKVIMTFEDITNRKKAEEATIKSKIEAEEANRTKSEFLATMSHELRTPLNSIIGYSQMLQDDSFGGLNPKQDKFTNHIHTSGKHLLELINDILDLSKIEAGKMDLHFEYFNVNEVMKNVFNIIIPLAEKKDIEISFVISEDISIYADKVKFKQILYNLLSNAVKFTPKGGHVTIDASSSKGVLNVSVADDGIGMSKEEQSKLFTPFYQADSSIARKYQGTGLGLSIVKKMVELQDGTVNVTSKPGKGSTFTFTMPIKKKTG